jgi:peroxiredoxin
MSRSLGPIALLVLVLGAIAGLQYMQRRPGTGYAAPDFALPDLQGKLYRLSDYRGRVVFLNLWATWCPPCRMEMPNMEALYKRLAHRDFVMLAVAEDEGGAAPVRSFVRDVGLSFPVLLDPEATLSPRYGATGYPETFIINRNGQVVNHTIGPAEWDSEQMVAYFEQLLAAPQVAEKDEDASGER